MWTIPMLLCSKCMSRKMWASTPYPAFTGPCLPPVPATPEVNEISPRTWEEAWMAWCGASPRSASISSPLWFKFNRWVHRRDTAAIKAACYLHIISQSITLTSRGAHFSPVRTHPQPTAGPPLCLLCAPACWLGDFGAIWHSTTAGRRVRSSLWSSQETFIILVEGKIQKKGQLRDGDGVGWF